jgi:hypothetical protein
MIMIIMRGENFVAHLDGLGGTPVCRGTSVAYHCIRPIRTKIKFAGQLSVQCLCPSRELNRGPPQFEARVLTTQQRLSMFILLSLMLAGLKILCSELIFLI